MAAQTLAEMREILSPMPLRGSDLDTLYEDLTPGRGLDVAATLRDVFENRRRPARVVLAAHRGTGKSTEIERLAGLLGHGFLVVRVESAKALDLDDVSHIDLLLVVMDALFAAGVEAGAEPPEDLRRDIQRWLAEEVLEQERLREWGAETEGGGGVSFLGALFAKFRGWLRSSKTQRHVLRERVEPRLAELLDRCNRLIADLAARTGRRPLLAIEDLDKVRDPRQADTLFRDGGPKLVGLDASLILSVPLAVWYSPQAAGVLGIFDCTQILPVVRTDREPGQTAFVRLVHRRVDPDLVNEEALRSAIRATGGLMRDLFRVLIDASLKAQAAKRQRVEASDVERSLRELQGHYERTLSSRENGPTAEQLVLKLLDVHALGTRAACDAACLDLLHGGQVIEYDGDRTLSVHPLVERYLRESRRIE